MQVASESSLRVSVSADEMAGQLADSILKQEFDDVFSDLYGPAASSASLSQFSDGTVCPAPGQLEACSLAAIILDC